MSSASATVSATASATTTAAAALKAPGNLKVVGVILAIVSGLLIGSSFVFKKKGLLNSQKAAGEGVAYLKSPLWWTGMIMMILGELCNFAAYAFVEAIVVTPMGALSVVICAILSHFFLKETLSLFGWLGCGLCILGSVIIALNGPEEDSVGQITEFEKLFLSPGFIVYGSLLIIAALVIIFYFAPKYGKKSMLWYIMVCSMIGGISVSVTTGLGSAIVTTAQGDNQFKHWFIYFLMVFIAVTLVTEVYYLNVALALFNTAMVTPTYYVIFTFFSIVTTIVLFKGLDAPARQIITLVMGFLVICVGITILQLSKIDPTQLKIPGLDRRSTILLQAARSNTEGLDEKDLAAVEDPGMDALRGSFGTMGSIIRARTARRMSMSSNLSGTARSRHGSGLPPVDHQPHYAAMGGHDGLPGVKRHQLYDPPMAGSDTFSMTSQSPRPSERKATIKFNDEEIVHNYPVPGRDGKGQQATHEHRNAQWTGVSNIAQPQPNAPPQLLLMTEELGDLRSAPPTIYEDPFRQRVDPFENSPSTTTLATFPSYTSSQASTIGRPPSAPHHHGLFGRSSSGGRPYPKGDQRDDREESQSLVHPSAYDVEADSDAELPPGGSVRLVPGKNDSVV